MKTFKIFFLYITIMLASCSDDIASGSYFASTNEYSLNFSSSGLQDVPAEGGVITAKIDATSAVIWELQALPSWLATTTMRGTGSQDISFNVDANESFNSPRTQIFNVVTKNSDWNVTIPITVTQQKKNKTLSITPSDNNSLTFDAKGGQLVLSVSSNLSWIVECTENFVHLSQTSGDADSKIGLTVDAYNFIDATANRTASVYFKDSNESETLQVIKITQTPLQYTIESENISVEFDQNSSAKDFSLGCISGGYSVSSDASWLQISKNKDRENIDVSLKVEQNENDDERSSKAYVHLEGSNAVRYVFSVKQKGNQIEISPSAISFSAGGGTNSVEVNANGRWKATVQDDWLSVRQDGKTCIVTAKENSSFVERSGAIRINRINDYGEFVGKAVYLDVTQNGHYANVDSESLTFGAESSSQVLTINSDVNWTLSTYDSWISLSNTSGAGNATVNVSVSDNETKANRQGVLYLSCSGKTIEVKVQQESATFSIRETSLSFNAEGGENSTYIYTNVPWKVKTSESWLSISPTGGDKDCYLNFIAERNSTDKKREAIVTFSSLAGEIKVYVTQSAPSIKMSYTNVTYLEDGWTNTYDGTRKFKVEITKGFEYEITSDSWIHVEKESSFSDYYLISVDNNNGPLRKGYITASVKVTMFAATIAKDILKTDEDNSS